MTWSDIPGDDPSNAAMINRDEPAAVPAAPEAEDPLYYVRDAIFTALEATRIDGATPQAMKERVGYVLDEVRKLLAPKPVVIGTFTYELADDATQGLTVEHRPGARWSVQ